MFEISEEIRSFFLGLPGYTDIMGNDCFPVFAPENTAFPLTTYKIEGRGTESKDLDSFEVSVFFWFEKESYKKVCQFTDAMTLGIKNSQYDWVNSSIEILEDNQSFYGVITFNKF